MNKLDKAIQTAAVAHQGQRRKGFGQPYLFHPLEVLSLVSLISEDEDIQCAAVLHDTVEDTPLTIKDIREQFGDKVADIVGDETEDKRGNVNKEATWKDRKQEAIDHLNACTNIGVKIVTLADKVSNLRSFHLLLLDRGEEAWNSFNMKDPLMHYWYYDSIKDALSELKDNPVYKEYEFLIETIFRKYQKGE